MTVADLIAALRDMPPDASVEYAWDGHLRTAVELVWLTRDGRVGLGGEDSYVYDADEAPRDWVLAHHSWRPK